MTAWTTIPISPTASCAPRYGAVSLTTAAGEEETAKVRSLGRAGSELADLFARIVQDCVCAAVNPPCAPCEDTDVPLACLEVADCTVVRICNAERDYVLSGTALRYWYPSSTTAREKGVLLQLRRARP